MNHLRRVVSIVTFSLLLGCGGKFAMSDREAGRLVEAYWAKHPHGDFVWLGHILVNIPSKSQYQMSKAFVEVPFSDVAVYKALQSEGLIQLSNEVDRSKRFGGWDSFFTLTQKGYIIEFDASAGSIDKSMLCSPYQYREAICAPPGKGQVTRIVKNDLIEKPPAVYRLVLGEHNWEWHPFEMKLRHLRNDINKRPREKFMKERKFGFLFKHDAFKNEWQVVGSVTSNADEELDDSPITKMLAK